MIKVHSIIISLFTAIAAAIPVFASDDVSPKEARVKKSTAPLSILEQMREKPARVVYLVDEDIPKLTELERQRARAESKGRSYIGDGQLSPHQTIAAAIRGAKSPVRVTVPRPKFIVKNLPGSDPRNVELVPMKRDDGWGWREVINSKKGIHPSGVLMDISEGGYLIVHLNIFPNKKDPLIVMMIPSIDLPEGEYAFSVFNDVFCFGVDLQSQRR